MRFLDATQRELLAKLGLHILDEREERQPLAAPIFEVQVEFPAPAAAEALRQWPNLSGYGIVGLQPELGPNATIDCAWSCSSRIASTPLAAASPIEEGFQFPLPFEVRRSRP